MTTAPIESIFSRAWQLLSANWIIIVPGIVVGIIVGIVGSVPAMLSTAAISTDGTYNASAAVAAGFTGLIAGLIGMVGFIATQAYTVGMAGAAWKRGTTTLADGSAAFQESAGNILITAIGLFVLGICAVFLSLFTFGLAFLAFILFTLYAMPAAIIGKQPGFSSILESFNIAKQRFVPTLIIAILIGVIVVLVGVVTVPLHFIPLLGPIIAAVITQIVVAYAVLVVVGEYLALRSEVPPPAYAGGAAPYPPGPSAYPPGPSASTPGPTPYQPGSATYTPPPPPPDPYTPPAPGP